MIKTAYAHLLNPFSSFFRDGTKPGDAPHGKLKLSDNPKLNLALWNTLAASAWMVPAAIIVSRLSNASADKKIRDKMLTALASRLTAARPSLSKTPNTADDIDVAATPAIDDLVASEMNKKASGIDILGLGDKLDHTSNSLLSKIVSHGVAPAMPIMLPMLAALLAAKYQNSSAKEEIKAQLMEDRNNLKQEQQAVDRLVLKTQGLITDDRQFNDKMISKRASNRGSRNAAASFLLSPITLSTLLSGAAAFLGYKYFKKSDDAANTIKVLTDRLIGSNHLQSAPKIGLAELPVDVKSILAVPGSTKKETLAIADPVSGAIEELTTKGDIIDVDPILEEVTAKKPKKDAIF